MDRIAMGMHLNFSRIIIKFLLGNFLLMVANVSGQTFGEKTLEGRVYSSDGDVAATHVLNTTTKKAAITDIEGFFSIGVHLNDTLVFSAVQFQKKTLVVTTGIWDSKFISIGLEETNIALDEVVVTPYNLTGELGRDMERLRVVKPITATSLGLPNAYVRIPTKAERQLYAATANPLMGFDPLINAITGYTKMLKKRVAQEKKYARTERVKKFYPDSVLVKELEIPETKLDDFLYFCEIDPNFSKVIDTQDKLRIWDYLRDRSVVYRKENETSTKY